MEKNIQKIKIKNQLELWAFCAVIGTAAGALVWALLKIMASGTEMIWEWIPEKIHIPYYTVLVCTVGGVSKEHDRTYERRSSGKNCAGSGK